jgi:hypothetical protein
MNRCLVEPGVSIKRTFVTQVRLLVVLVLLGGFTALPGQEPTRK